MTTRERQEDKRLASHSHCFGENRSPILQPSDNTDQIESNAAENQRLHLHATRMILQESKDCIKKFIDEAIIEFAPYSTTLMGYHDQTYQNTKEIADIFLEILNEAAFSFQSALDPYLRTHDDGINYFYRWVAPIWIAQTYRNTICNMVNYMVITIKLANAIVFPNMQSLQKMLVEQRKNANALSRIPHDRSDI
jgi:hypothetical protein